MNHSFPSPLPPPMQNKITIFEVTPTLLQEENYIFLSFATKKMNKKTNFPKSLKIKSKSYKAIN